MKEGDIYIYIYVVTQQTSNSGYKRWGEKTCVCEAGASCAVVRVKKSPRDLLWGQKRPEDTQRWCWDSVPRERVPKPDCCGHEGVLEDVLRGRFGEWLKFVWVEASCPLVGQGWEVVSFVDSDETIGNFVHHGFGCSFPSGLERFPFHVLKHGSYTLGSVWHIHGALVEIFDKSCRSSLDCF